MQRPTLHLLSHDMWRRLPRTQQELLIDDCMPLLLWKPHDRQLDCALFEHAYRDVLLAVPNDDPIQIGRLFCIGPRKDHQSNTNHSPSVHSRQKLQMFVLEMGSVYDLSIYNVTDPAQVKNTYASRNPNGVVDVYYS